MIVSPTQSNVLKALRSFLLSVLPPGVECVLGQVNRVPEVKGKEYLVLSVLRNTRLRTNVDTAADCKFTGAIAATAMTVSVLTSGAIAIGATVFGTGVAAGTTVVDQVSGAPGGVGVYTVAPSQTVSSRTLSAGQMDLEQGAEYVVQIDFHSAGLQASDYAMTVSTTFRDPFATEFFAAQVPSYAAPLYADDPRQVPFINDQQQWEWRWVLEAHLQANPVVVIPQQYADEIDVGINSVDATFPP